MIDYLMPYEYVQGYTAALQDVLETIDGLERFSKHNPTNTKIRQSYKTYKDLIKCMIENRCLLRENPDAFIRYNVVTKEFEAWWKGRKKDEQ